MGMDSACFEALRRNLTGTEKNILCLGYPDMLVHEETIRDTLGELPARVSNEREVQKWHNWGGPVYDTTEVLAGLGVAPTYIDIKPSRGVEFSLDLNRSVYLLDMDHPIWGTRWDVVADFGTLEHCFNIPQAFENIKMLGKPGALVMHVNPLNMINHGFWNISPTTYFDWWEAQGAKVVEASVSTTKDNVITEQNILGKQFQRFTVGEEALIRVAVRLGPTEYATKWPTQRKFQGV